MTADRQTYQRAVTASLIGFSVLMVLAKLILMLGLWKSSGVVLTASWYAYGGAALWLVLAIIYQQHKLERVEALEADELAQRHGTDSSIFASGAEELSIARRRLRRLEKFALPIVSLFTGLYLVGIGAWLLVKNSIWLQATPIDPDSLDRDALMVQIIGESAIQSPGIIAGVLFGVAFAAFVVSRYVAGMARNAEWRMLRGGAGYLMGIALVAAALGIGFGLFMMPAKYSAAFKYLGLIIPGFMVLIGLEIGVNLILDIYRPRKAGEPVRPAFDSRLLSFLTSPESIARSINEAINYQFGFELTQSWFWQLFTRALPTLLVIGGAVLISISSLVFVSQGEQGVVMRFGQLRATDLQPGLHLKLPWPIDRVQTYPVMRVHQIALGSAGELKPDEPILWANEHYTGQPDHMIVAAPAEIEAAAPAAIQDGANPVAATGGTPSVSLLNTEVFIQYRIRDLGQYVTQTAEPVELLRTLAEQQLSEYLLQKSVDEWLRVSREQASATLKARIQRAANDAKLGLEIVEVPVASIHPPKDVAEAFQAPIIAEQNKQRVIEEAEAESIRLLAGAAGTTEAAEALVARIRQLDAAQDRGEAPAKIRSLEQQIEDAVTNAGGEASELLATARAERWELENRQRSEVALYAEDLVAFQSAPGVYKMRAYLETLTRGADRAKLYLILADPDRTTIRFDLKEIDTTFGDVDPTTGE